MGPRRRLTRPPAEGAAGLPHFYSVPTSGRPLLAGVVTHPRPNTDYDFHAGFEIGMAWRHEHERLFPDLVQPVRPGDVWMACAWELHGYRARTSNTESIVIIFLPEVLGEETLAGLPWVSLFAAPPRQRPQVRTEQLREQVLRIAGDVREEVIARLPGWEEAVRLSLLRLLLALRREWEPPETGLLASASPTTDLVRVMPALEALQTDFGHRPSLEQAGVLCGLSAPRFAVLFRRAMGTSFGHYAQNARMAQVTQRLLATDQSIEVIAAQLGFTDGSHLHRAFVKHYHVTPAAYRRQAR